MSAKTLVMMGMMIGGFLGAVLATGFGASFESGIPILTSGIGSFAGIWICYKLSRYL